jgi:Asp-tRNA(Asn)/Glu-tRNA(Gln) amidotransferase A subunit family amidase
MTRMTERLGPLRELSERLASGAISPREVVERALERANSNESCNVYLGRDVAWTLGEADRVEREFAGREKPALYGVPVSLKDCLDLAGFVTTCGSRFYAKKNGVARADSGVAARLRAQGAVITGKTNIHQLTYGITGENPDYGDCLQPGHAEWLTGGSSSGAAASVMEGSAMAAIGTDTGGSIRVPAALCGLCGYRASIDLAYARGLWSGGMHLAPSFDTLGWIFRDLLDGPLLAKGLFALDVPQRPAREGVTIGCVAEEFLRDCDANVLEQFALWRAELGRVARIVSVDSAFWEEAMEIYAPIQAFEAAAFHGPQTGGDFSVFERGIAERLAWGASLSEGEIAGLRLRHAAFRERMDKLLRVHDFLIAPCAPVSRLLAGTDQTDARKRILRYATPFSLAGVPVVTLPGAGGAGVQLVASRGADARLLTFAAGIFEDSEKR